MQKIILFFVLVFFVSSCSVFRKTKITPEVAGDIANIYERVKNENISEKNFNIRRVDIEFISGNNNEKLMANVKFRKPSEYLISIRTRTGIEGIRLFITGDTVIINDRINRKVLYGSMETVGSRYGISMDMIKMVSGDMLNGFYILGMDSDKKNNFLMFEGDLGGKKVSGRIDTGLGKIKEADIEGSGIFEEWHIEYDEFTEVDGIVIPQKVVIENEVRDIVVRMNIKNVEFDDTEIPEFIPGSRYERIMIR
jgi:hypothetical protein